MGVRVGAKSHLAREFDNGPARGTVQRMDMLEGIMTTRAMRRLSTEPVATSDIETCLRAAAQAPNGGNIQPWQFVVVDDRAVIGQLAEVYLRCWDRYQKVVRSAMKFRTPEDEATYNRSSAAAQHLADHFAEVPVVAVFCVADIDLTMHDDVGPLDIGSVLGSVFPAVQNFMLAARGLGLGTSMTTLHRIEQPLTRSILGIPDRLQIAAIVPVGHPTGRFGVAPRKPVHALTHWNQFGNKRSF